MADADRAYMPQAQRHDWETPPDLFDALWEEFGGFDLDPCCAFSQHTATRVVDAGGMVYIAPGISDGPSWKADGLAQSWHGKVYMNPPHDQVAKWVAKAHHEVGLGNASLVVALVPARVDTKWWQAYVLSRVWWRRKSKERRRYYACAEATDVRFLKGRLKFVGAKASAPFPSAIVVWRGSLRCHGEP